MRACHGESRAALSALTIGQVVLLLEYYLSAWRELASVTLVGAAALRISLVVFTWPAF